MAHCEANSGFFRVDGSHEVELGATFSSTLMKSPTDILLEPVGTVVLGAADDEAIGAALEIELGAELELDLGGGIPHPEPRFAACGAVSPRHAKSNRERYLDCILRFRRSLL